MAEATPPRPEQGPASPGRFQRDVLWNLSSTVVLAAGGLLLIRLVVERHGPGGFGVFAQVWAPYVIFSQLAVGGLDRSILRALAAQPLERAQRGPVVWAALLPALLSSALFALLFYALRETIAGWYASPDVAAGVAAAAPGLFCFGVNKVLLGVTNGLRRMRAFAIYQSLRYVLMPLGVLVSGWLGLPSAQVSFLFTFAEGALLLVLLGELLVQVPLPGPSCVPHVRAHVSYGLRSIASGVLLEVNSRVDVWLLGHHASDLSVGVYGAALQVAEGIFQLLVALQNIYNPLMARSIASGDRAGLERLVRRGGRRAFALMGAIALASMACYPTAVRLLLASPDFQRGWAAFAILMAGIWLASIRMPFFQFLLMARRPGWHSVFMLAVVAVNVLGNALLIPPLGINGSALGTAISFVASVALLALLARKVVGVRL